MEDQKVYCYGTTQIHIGPGATLAHLVNPMPGQRCMTIRYASGGTLMDLVGFPYGATGLTVDQLVTAQNKSYRVDVSATGTFHVRGPARFYLMCQGATALVNLVAGIGPGDGRSSFNG